MKHVRLGRISAVAVFVLVACTVFAQQRVFRPGMHSRAEPADRLQWQPGPKTGEDWNDLLAANGKLMYQQLVDNCLDRRTFEAASARTNRVFIPLAAAYLFPWKTPQSYDELPAFEYHLRHPRTDFVRWKLLGEHYPRPPVFATVADANAAVAHRFSAYGATTAKRVKVIYPLEGICCIVLDTSEQAVVDFVDCRGVTQLDKRMPDDVDEEAYRVAYEAKIHSTLYGLDVTAEELESAVKKALAEGNDSPRPLRDYPLELTTAPPERKHFIDPSKKK